MMKFPRNAMTFFAQATRYVRQQVEQEQATHSPTLLPSSHYRPFLAFVQNAREDRAVCCHADQIASEYSSAIKFSDFAKPECPSSTVATRPIQGDPRRVEKQNTQTHLDVENINTGHRKPANTGWKTELTHVQGDPKKQMQGKQHPQELGVFGSPSAYNFKRCILRATPQRTGRSPPMKSAASVFAWQLMMASCRVINDEIIWHTVVLPPPVSPTSSAGSSKRNARSNVTKSLRKEHFIFLTFATNTQRTQTSWTSWCGLVSICARHYSCTCNTGKLFRTYVMEDTLPTRIRKTPGRSIVSFFRQKNKTLQIKMFLKGHKKQSNCCLVQGFPTFLLPCTPLAFQQMNMYP